MNNFRSIFIITCCMSRGGFGGWWAPANPYKEPFQPFSPHKQTFKALNPLQNTILDIPVFSSVQQERYLVKLLRWTLVLFWTLIMVKPVNLPEQISEPHFGAR